MVYNMTPCVTYTKWSKSHYEIGHFWITYFLVFNFSFENLFSFACEWKLISVCKDEHQGSLCKRCQSWFRNSQWYRYGASSFWGSTCFLGRYIHIWLLGNYFCHDRLFIGFFCFDCQSWCRVSQSKDWKFDTSCGSRSFLHLWTWYYLQRSNLPWNVA